MGKSIASVNQLDVFYVINVSPIKVKNGRVWEIELVRPSDLGENEEILESVTNLDWIKAGDMIEGYDINKLSNTVDLFGDQMKKYRKRHSIPDVIIIQKHLDEELESNGKRRWKLKRINNIKLADNYKMDKHSKEKESRDYQMFLDQLTFHKHLRAQINIYKNEQYDGSEQKDNDDDNWQYIDDKELIQENVSNAMKANNAESDNGNE